MHEEVDAANTHIKQKERSRWRKLREKRAPGPAAANRYKQHREQPRLRDLELGTTKRRSHRDRREKRTRRSSTPIDPSLLKQHTEEAKVQQDAPVAPGRRSLGIQALQRQVHNMEEDSMDGEKLIPDMSGSMAPPPHPQGMPRRPPHHQCHRTTLRFEKTSPCTPNARKRAKSPAQVGTPCRVPRSRDWLMPGAVLRKLADGAAHGDAGKHDTTIANTIGESRTFLMPARIASDGEGGKWLAKKSDINESMLMRLAHALVAGDGGTSWQGGKNNTCCQNPP